MLSLDALEYEFVLAAAYPMGNRILLDERFLFALNLLTVSISILILISVITVLVLGPFMKLMDYLSIKLDKYQQEIFMFVQVPVMAAVLFFSVFSGVNLFKVTNDVVFRKQLYCAKGCMSAIEELLLSRKGIHKRAPAQELLQEDESAEEKAGLTLDDTNRHVCYYDTLQSIVDDCMNQDWPKARNYEEARRYVQSKNGI